MKKIRLVRDGDVLAFAKEELQKTFDQILCPGSCYDLKLGLLSDFGLTPRGKDPVLDDEFAIEVQQGTGYLAGSNPRSVLFAAYRYLEACGVCWLRPGKDGTLYPKNAEPADLSLREAASLRHRTMCIEGSVSLQNVLDMIEWLPKLRYNSYFIQFHNPYDFFGRWYSHRDNPLKQPEPFTPEDSAGFTGILHREIKKRGLLLQAVGHGWTCEPFGVPNLGWNDMSEENIPASYKNICALVNGKREVWHQKPILTQLCFSQASVRATMVRAAVEYLRENPSVDILHFWTGDDYNNYCECEECSKMRESDNVLQILNDVDRALTENGLDTRIVFHNGYNLGFPPIREKLNHPERYILMFAPITRTFAESFPDHFRQKELPEYQRNGFDCPVSVDENLAYLYQWQQIFHGDCVDFDYHLMYDYVLDAGGEGIARVLWQDIKNLSPLGMNGFISCQLTRNSFPTSLAMTVMGRTLWNTDTDFETVRRELYAKTFGAEYAERMEHYFAALSLGFSVGVLRNQKPIPAEQAAANMRKALAAMDEMKPLLEAPHEGEACVQTAWKHLALHQKIYRLLGESVLAYFEGDPEKADALKEQSFLASWQSEDALADVFDAYFYHRLVTLRMKLG